VRVELPPDARTELRSAALWYDEQRDGLGAEFLNAVASALDRISREPESSPPWTASTIAHPLFADTRCIAFHTWSPSNSIRTVCSCWRSHMRSVAPCTGLPAQNREHCRQDWMETRYQWLLQRANGVNQTTPVRVCTTWTLRREWSRATVGVRQAFETTFLDVRYALRAFRRSPGFVLTVAATIALGLGINMALFTLFNAYVLRPIPIRDPYSLYTFTWTTRAGREHTFSWDEYRRFRENNGVFSEVAAVESVQTRLNGRVFQGQLVTGNYFQMLGVGTSLGRTLLPEDAAVPGRDPVVVLSYEAWQTIFAGRTDIIGAKIMIRGSPMQVIGVARKGFQDLSEVPRDFWAPVTVAGRLQDGPDLFGAEHPERLTIIGRIRPGQRISSAEATLAAWSRQMTSQQPDERKAVGVLLRSNATAIPLTRELLLVFSPLAAAFALALLLACANVASMMLARAVTRQREIGIRLSLGAARGRLIRQLLTESVLLSVPAAFLGWIVSQVTIEASLRIMYVTVPRDMLELLHEVTLPVDWRVIVFMFFAALTSAVLFGLVPAIQATRSNVILAARGEFAADLRPVRLRNGLVLAQITACTLLLVACGALLRTTVAMSSFDIGFRTGGVVAMEVVENARRRVLDAIVSDPVVDAIAAASSIPLGGLVPSITMVTQDGSAISAAYNYVSPGILTY